MPPEHTFLQRRLPSAAAVARTEGWGLALGPMHGLPCPPVPFIEHLGSTSAGLTCQSLPAPWSPDPIWVMEEPYRGPVAD